MRAYLDHASTSPLRPAAREAMAAAANDGVWGDPGRVHAEGLRARVAVETAREQVAQLVGARPSEVLFTSGATEAIATAVFGATQRRPGTAGVVLAAVEHAAVRVRAEHPFIPQGQATVVGVDHLGRIDADELLAAVTPSTALVHVQWGNHEVGTLQPVRAVVDGCRERGVLVHIDAAQAGGRVPLGFTELGADLMSVSGHKFGAPQGVGALLVRRGLRLPALLLGGDQERARRAGMENVVSLIGFGAAADEAAASLDAEADRQRGYIDRVTAALKDTLVPVGDTEDRLPHIACFTVPGVEPQPVLIGLDRAGVAVHSGSSCSSEAFEDSPVLAAMGADAHRSLRVSVGWSTTDDDVDRLLDVLPGVLESVRGNSPAH
ncbi:MAG: cysteine desulfurase family protein [Actinomycetes bacterium]